jgi:hypothetical protein
MALACSTVVALQLGCEGPAWRWQGPPWRGQWHGSKTNVGNHLGRVHVGIGLHGGGCNNNEAVVSRGAVSWRLALVALSRRLDMVGIGGRLWWSYSSHSILAGWKDGKASDESFLWHSMSVLATATPSGVIYLVGGIAVDASCPSLEGLLIDLHLGRGSGQLRWSSSSSSHRVMALLLLVAISKLRWLCLRLLRGCTP